MAASPTFDWFALTKVQAPARRQDALSRPRLLQAVEQGLAASRLTLISAPAGAGKTTLLSDLPHAIPSWTFVWLLLDDEDNDPGRFVSVLTASMQRINPKIGERETAATIPGVPPWRQSVTAIINDLASLVRDPVVLVLDDAHVIQPGSVPEILDYLIEKLPAHVRLLIASRHHPPLSLTRWRARGELAEITLDDLSFTTEETSDLVNRCLGLSLEPPEVEALRFSTQGWATGIRLLATSIAQSPSGRRRLLGGASGPSRSIFDYLAEEILNKQLPEIRRFLLESSILSSLHPTVCAALTGRGDAAAILQDLYRRNLFVVAADDTETNYRYHDLFAEFLRNRLEAERPGDVKTLHARAAETEMPPGQRIHHLIAAELWPQAAAEIEAIAPEFIARELTATVRRWIHYLPEEIRNSHPRLIYFLGRAAWGYGDFAEAAPYLQLALAGFRKSGDEEGQGEALVALANTAVILNQPDRIEKLIAAALAFPIPPASRLQLLCSRAWQSVIRRNPARAQSDIEQMMELLATPEGFSQRNPIAIQLCLFSMGMPGGVDRLERLCRGIASWLGEARGVNQAFNQVLRSGHLLAHGDFDESDRACEMAEIMARQSGGILFVESAALYGRALASLAMGDWEMSTQWSLANRSLQSESEFGRAWIALPNYSLGRARWHAGDVRGLQQAYEELCRPNPQEMPVSPIFRPILRGLLHLSNRAYQPAELAFEEALEAEEAFQISRPIASAACLLAHLHFLRGQPREALARFEPFLAVCQREGTPGYVLREGPIALPLLRLAHEKGLQQTFVENLLSRMGASLAPVMQSGERLSDRELEVLRLMAEGLGNREIGERLFVSEATVKTHVQRILRKLDAVSRTQAVARARESMLV